MNRIPDLDPLAVSRVHASVMIRTKSSSPGVDHTAPAPTDKPQRPEHLGRSLTVVLRTSVASAGLAVPAYLIPCELATLISGLLAHRV